MVTSLGNNARTPKKPLKVISMTTTTTAPVKAAPVKVAPVKVATTTTADARTYAMGKGKYNPRVEHNSVAWDKVKAAITIKGKGKATHAELCAALDTHFTKADETHHDFIGYMERRDAITVVKA